ncbi:unnamed protein product [Closterium sp. NIES-53]
MFEAIEFQSALQQPGAAGGAAAGAAGGAAGATGSAAADAAGGAARQRPYFVQLLQQVLGSPPSPPPTPPPPFLSPPPVQSQSQLPPDSPLPGPSPYSGPTRGLTEHREPESRPVSPASRPASPVRTVRAGRVSRSRLPPVPGTYSMTMRPSTAPQRVSLPSPPVSSLPDGPDPESDSLRAASPTVTRFLATAVTNPLFKSSAAFALVAELVDFAAACRLDYAASLVAESVSASVCPPSVGGECALGTDVLEDRQEDLECFAAASPHLVSMLLAPEGDPDALDIPTPRSYAEAIEGPYSSQWQAAMDVEMASLKSTGTYVDEVPPPGANIVSGMWIFRVKRPPGSPPAFKARYVARGFSQRQGVDFFQTFSPTPKMTTLQVLLHVAAQRDYELHSLDFSIAFLQGSLHEEIWLRRPPGFTGSFPAGTQWSLRRPVYGLRQAPREWHDTLRTTLAALGFAPSTADPSLFLRTDTTLPPFYVLVYVDDLVFATADTEALAHVKSELQKRHTCTDLGELTSYLGLRITRDRAQRTITLTQSHMVQQVLQRFGFTYSSPQSTPLPTGHSLSAPPSDESVEPSGPYPELVGCLMYLMTCTRPDLAYPLSLLARYVASGGHRKVHWDAAKRVLRYLCSTSGMGLVLGGRARVVLTGHADASWVDDLATQRSSQGCTFSLGSGSVSWRSTRSSSVLSSSCEAKIYAGAMAAQELRWLTYLLTDLREVPRSPLVLYVDNKAMLALCQEHRLEHRTKHIALRYFLARELEQRGQLRLPYVASLANTADVFTKALQPCDHQPCFGFLDWSCDLLFSATLPMGGIRHTFTLPASPQQNGIAERRIGMVMDVARTSMIHAAAPHFLWPFAVQYAAHQLNLQPRVSVPETSPTLRWTGKVGDASAFRVWGSRAFVRDLSGDKLSPRAVPCVFLGFPPDAPGWQFYHPTSRRVLSSHDVTFDESVPFYRLFPYRTAPLPPPLLFLAPGPPPVDPLTPQGPAPSGVSQVDAVEPVEVAIDSGAARGAELAGAGSGGAESRGAEPGGAESGGAESGGAEPGGAEPRGAEAGGSPVAPGPGGARTGGTRAAGAGGAAATTGVGPAGASGATSAGAAGGVGAGVGAAGASGAAGAGAAGGVGAGVCPSGGPVRPRPYFVPLLEQVLGLLPSPGPAPPLDCPHPVPSQSPLQPVSPLPAPSPYAGPTRGLAERREPASRPPSPVSSTRPSRRDPRPRPPAVPGTHQMTLRPSTAPLRVPLPSPPESSLPVLADPAFDSLRAASPTAARLLSTVVTDPSFESTAASALVAELVDFAACCRLDFAASLVAESASVCPLSVGGECALSTDVLEDRQEEFQCFAAALPHLVSMLIAPEGDPDAPDIPTPRSYAEAIEGPYSSQWQSAMDAEMASWKSTGTYVDDVPPPWANIVSGMWIFRVKRPPGSPPVFKARYVARGFSQRQGVDYFQTFSPTPKMTTLRVLLHVAAQRDYELHSLDFSIAFLQGSLHEEIWLRRPPGFTGLFPPGTQWSLRRPVYGLRQAPREWHDTLRTTLAALGFAPSTADPSLFLRTDTSLPPFYILVYVDDLVFATADTAGLAHVKSELQKRHTCTDLGELRSYLGLQITRDRAQRTITLTQSHMVQQVLQRFDFTYSSPQATPLSTRHSLSALPSDESVEPSGPILARYVAHGRHRPEHMAAAKRVLRYLCSTSGLGLVLGGRRPVVLTDHADASWADDQATQRSSQGYTFSLGSGSVSWRSTRSSSVLGSSCEAEIYAGAMAAQDLRWLTYLLTNLGEPPRSPPVLYVDNKAMLAFFREHRLEHRTKHIALRYFLACELQQRGQLRLAYVASQANTADIFTKALPPGDHQRLCTMLACFALLD